MIFWVVSILWSTEKLSAPDIVLYLRVLQKLVPQLNLSNQTDDDMSDSDDEEDDTVAMDTRVCLLDHWFTIVKSYMFYYLKYEQLNSWSSK